MLPARYGSQPAGNAVGVGGSAVSSLAVQDVLEYLAAGMTEGQILPGRVKLLFGQNL